MPRLPRGMPPACTLSACSLMHSDSYQTVSQLVMSEHSSRAWSEANELKVARVAHGRVCASALTHANTCIYTVSKLGYCCSSVADLWMPALASQKADWPSGCCHIVGDAHRPSCHQHCLSSLYASPASLHHVCMQMGDHTQVQRVACRVESA